MKNLVLGLIILCSALVNGAGGSEQLTATIIGSGGPIYNKNRASACVLISMGNTRILVDMGNGTQANLSKLGAGVRQFSALLFTHHHLDHNEEFVPLFISSLMGRHKFTIIGPPNTVKLTKTNLKLYAEDITYRLGKSQRTLADRKKAYSVRDIKGGKSFVIDNIRISTLKVPHTIHTIAYRFDYKGKSIVVTGDLTFSESLPKLAKDADFMIIDSGGMVMKGGQRMGRGMQGPRQGMRRPRQGTRRLRQSRVSGERHKSSRTRAHLNLQESSLIAKQANVKNLVYTHFRAGEVDQEASLKEIRKNYSGNVIFGEDLMVLSDGGENPPTGSSIKAGGYRIAGRNPRTGSPKTAGGYPIVDTGQVKFYSTDREIRQPARGDSFYGQDASYAGNQPSYTDNNNGTITDNVTGLMWQKVMAEKMSFEDAFKRVRKFELGGHSDWRIPSIKELYSLIKFTGKVQGHRAIDPFIDTGYFNQPFGNTSLGERQIDAQTWSSTEYVGRTMRNDATVFGVNFIDGRIKGYPKYNPRTRRARKMYFRFVRGNNAYGKNNFVNNENGTITDSATGLMWQQSDSKKGMQWEDALKYAERLKLGRHSDWRLPNAKELHSIVDYTRSVQTSGSPAINPIFKTTEIKDPEGKKQYPYFWTGTTHLEGRNRYIGAVYIAFGKALGKMHGRLMDVHGAGAQRSDPKVGNKKDYPQYFGPQGDARFVFNYVRCVRSVKK